MNEQAVDLFKTKKLVEVRGWLSTEVAPQGSILGISKIFINDPAVAKIYLEKSGQRLDNVDQNPSRTSNTKLVLPKSEKQRG